ncbi:MAG: hypothetical protein V4588_03320 [Pseudomonadota bacterium]
MDAIEKSLEWKWIIVEKLRPVPEFISPAQQAFKPLPWEAHGYRTDVATLVAYSSGDALTGIASQGIDRRSGVNRLSWLGILLDIKFS